jgi:nucleotidyltransferase/DNA polymerase involved in DNA repair
MKRLKNLTLLVEQLSIDEAFMDVSSQLEDGETIARRLQSTIRDELGLPSSLGVATNKLVAKIANNFGKASHTGDGPPFAITVVPPGGEADFLAPLSAQELWGVGPKTAERLAEMGVHTIGDLARYPVADLTRRFGKHGYDMARRACGIDESPVVIEHETKSVSAERTFVKDITARTTLHQKIIEVTGHTVRRLRRERLKGRTVHIKLRWEDFTTITRQTTLPRPTDNAEEISRVAIRLFDENWEQGTPVRLVGVGVSGFDVVTQLGLWDQQEEDSGPLKETLAEIERRFGRGVVRRADELDG